MLPSCGQGMVNQPNEAREAHAPENLFCHRRKPGTPEIGTDVPYADDVPRSVGLAAHAVRGKDLQNDESVGASVKDGRTDHAQDRKSVV